MNLKRVVPFVVACQMLRSIARPEHIKIWMSHINETNTASLEEEKPISEWTDMFIEWKEGKG